MAVPELSVAYATDAEAVAAGSLSCQNPLSREFPSPPLTDRLIVSNGPLPTMSRLLDPPAGVLVAPVTVDDGPPLGAGDVLRELFKEYGPCLILIDECGQK